MMHETEHETELVAPEEAPEDYNPETDTFTADLDGGLVVVRRNPAETPDEILPDLRPPASLPGPTAEKIASRWARLERDIHSLRAALQLAIADHETRFARLSGWFGPALLTWASETIGRGKPRRHVTPQGVVVSLRKDRDRIELRSLDHLLEWQAENASPQLVRRAVKIDELSEEGMRKLVAAIKGAGIDCRVREVRELKKDDALAHLKATGEVPGGCALVRGTDRLRLELP